jgi:hypothetical protein
VGRPRYQRARLLGERLVADLAQDYLGETSERLRPGSYKSVRFALSLLTSHLGKLAVGDLSLNHVMSDNHLGRCRQPPWPVGLDGRRACPSGGQPHRPD